MVSEILDGRTTFYYQYYNLSIVGFCKVLAVGECIVKTKV